MTPAHALLGADLANHEGLTPQAVSLGPDGLRRMANIAAAALRLTPRVLDSITGDDAALVRDILVLQVNYQVTLGVHRGERVADSESRGARSATWSAQRKQAPGTEGVADLLARYGVRPWGSAITTLRPSVRGRC